ncbi:MAG: hypothetical protein ACREBD_28385 [Blastocatellia bacterium]
MTTAVSEILKQAAFLSAEEQQELAARLLEQARQQPDQQHSNGTPGESAPPLPASAVPEVGEEADDDSILDVFSLNRVPPKRTYTMQVSYKFIGRGKPMPYELDDDDLLDEEAGSEGELR